MRERERYIQQLRILGRPCRSNMHLLPSPHGFKRTLWFGVIGSYIKEKDGLQGEALKVY
jgi:hypothetical protein